MYASKTILVFLAFLVAFVAAHPIRHVHKHVPRRRSACRPRATGVNSSPVAPAAGSAPTPDVTLVNSNVKGNLDPITNEDSAPVKEGTSTSTKETTSTSVKPKPTDSTSDAPEPTTTKPASNQGSSNNKLSALFPVPNFSKSWSTSPLADSPLPLSDGTLRPTRLISSLSHDYVSAPDGKKAMKAHYPKGSYTFTHQPQGGLSFYAPGPSSVDLTTAKEATFGYSVFFEAGFKFQKGGKLPGICT